MREIFFKGVAVENKPEAGVRIYDVVYGIPLVRKGKRYMYIEDPGIEVRICDKGVCQYTGMSDATRKFIYEHDILEDVKGDRFEVVYDEDRAAFVLKNENGDTYDKLGYSPAMYVVVGNRVLDKECSNRERFIKRIEEFIADESAEKIEIDKEDAWVISHLVDITEKCKERSHESNQNIPYGKIVPGSLVVRFNIDSSRCCGMSSIYIAATAYIYGSGPEGKCGLDIKMKIIRVNAGGALVSDMNVKDMDGCFDEIAMKKLSEAIRYHAQKISDAIYYSPYEDAMDEVIDIIESVIVDIFSESKKELR